MKKLLPVVALVVAAMVGGMTATGGVAGASSQSPNEADQATSTRILKGYQNNQPVPVFTYSQLRQNLIEIETAQAQTTQTTSFFFNQGVAAPIMSCPSIGFPIPTTYQLSNPEQLSRHGGSGGGGNVVLPQVEANGAFTGDSSGTYVICVNAQGQPYASYWEGFVQTVTGPATWSNGQVQLTGPPSFKFSKSKGDK